MRIGRRLALGLLAAAFTATVCSARERPELLILVGQSNALGFSLDPARLPPDAAATDPRVQIWQAGRFVTLTPGANTGAPGQPATWGPEVGFVRAWKAAHPEGALYVVKHARGSIPLAVDPVGADWAPASGELYAKATAAVTAARTQLRAQGIENPKTTIVWGQGESDSVEPARAAAYRQNLEALIEAMRRDWQAADARFVIVKIPDWGHRAAEVRAAQAAVAAADDRVVAVEGHGLPMQDDGLHISADGQLQLGAAIARAAESGDANH